MIKRTPARRIHAIAYCQVCFNHNEDMNRAQEWAKQHTKEFGHRVSVEIGYYYNTYISPTEDELTNCCFKPFKAGNVHCSNCGEDARFINK